uniref:U6 snRNA phosphodiesterase 1 n=1 Tax=Amphimedon queenslandica TaxID=400682 RepID=A0A1X7ULY6_AMPQE
FITQTCFCFHRFPVSFDGLVFYVNDDTSRSFLGLHVQEGHQELCSIVDDIDRIFEKFKLPKFYTERSFHVSLYWALGNILPSINQELEAKLKLLWKECLLENDFTEELTVNVSSISCKCGNKQFTFNLT